MSRIEAILDSDYATIENLSEGEVSLLESKIRTVKAIRAFAEMHKRNREAAEQKASEAELSGLHEDARRWRQMVLNEDNAYRLLESETER